MSTPDAERDQRDERELALAVVRTEGDALEKYPAFQDDKEVVLEAVANRGRALRFASSFLQNDEDVVSEAVASDCAALQYASSDLLGDLQFVLAMVTRNGWALEHVSPALRSDREVVLAAMGVDGLAFGTLQFAAPSLEKDEEVRRRVARGVATAKAREA